MTSTIFNVVLSLCDVASLVLNNQEKPVTKTEKEKRQEQRKVISNVRNAVWLARRVFK